MRCFNHEEHEAIGTCITCGRALCRECIAENAPSIVCREPCGAASPATGASAKSGGKKIKQNNATGLFNSLVFIVAVSLSTCFLMNSVTRKGDSQSDSSPRETLYDRMELGEVNTFAMDTAILSSRTIYFNYDFNELSCGWLIKMLWMLDSRNHDPIDLHICSGGGYISEAKAVCNVIQSLGSKVNTIASGSCASSALRTVAAGTGIRAAWCNTVMMFHGGDFEERDNERSYDAVAEQIEISDWQSMTKIPAAMILDTAEFNMLPAKALEFGIIDTIFCRK